MSANTIAVSRQDISTYHNVCSNRATRNTFKHATIKPVTRFVPECLETSETLRLAWRYDLSSCFLSVLAPTVPNRFTAWAYCPVSLRSWSVRAESVRAALWVLESRLIEREASL